ncbi:MarR family winged helix-turn-helix transcriptional regulator [Nocardiopsis composta]|uniref:DNA-binding MarR family transcriptional regulator n=1 Tax=Nocardiopsis composta TaxID=157465 RepID=A0A7W8VBF7_9ACTN|nr:MarR family winged helix-turn-helix transcriptional regulator [Nocardiopsis composta]MBB5430286.1 DNA-binding MarR family transcriptional regulator [Nocardiopsis composta]
MIADAPAPGPGRTLFRFVRHWSRRIPGADPEHGRDVMVTEAVLARQEEGGATVNAVAEELGIDQSGASRLVSRAERNGYLRKAPAPGDARRRVLVVTDEGAALLRAAHRWQESVFAELTADWTGAEVEEFHRLMGRLTAARYDRPEPGGRAARE